MDGFTCCNGTALESGTKLQDSIYFHDANHQALYVNLFVPSTLAWTERNVGLTQRTSFPYEDTSRLVIRGGGKFDRKIRVPKWATRGFRVKINGQPQTVNAAPGSYGTLQQVWKDNDTIEVQMPFTFHLHRVRDQPNIASLFYGPVLLAAEEAEPRSDWRPISSFPMRPRCNTFPQPTPIPARWVTPHRLRCQPPRRAIIESCST